MPAAETTTKRCRSSSPDEDIIVESAPKRHRPNRTTPILRLSDELFLRIASYLPTGDLAALQLVSHRCSRIAVDGQIWKALYYRRYVRPRASRIPRLLRGQLEDYASPRSIWLEEEGIAREVGTNWKALYRLRHNWGKGVCGVREIDVAGEDEEYLGTEGSSDLLVRLHEGIVFTASSTHGLRAWRLDNADQLIARTSLYSDTVIPFARVGVPTALAVDEEGKDRKAQMNVTVGFSNGAFTMYQLNMSQELSVFQVRYVHVLREHAGASNKITAMASLGPFLSIARGQLWDVYDFSGSSGSTEDDAEEVGSEMPSREGAKVAGPDDNMDSDDDDESNNSSSTFPLPQSDTAKRIRMTHSRAPQLHVAPVPLQAPKLVTSLRSSTAWPPVALSLRRSVNGTLLASIAYTSPLYTSGWSVGMQELRFSTEPTTTLKESRIATSVPAGFTPESVSGGWLGGGGSAGEGGVGTAGINSGHVGSQLYDPPLARPTDLSYCHPYLVTSHADNTLTLHLVRSTTTTLSIDPGQRLWGHTAGVANVLVDSRGKAVSIDRAGNEMHVWELEGGVSERRRVSASVRVRDVAFCQGCSGSLGGFDEEKVVVLRDAAPSSETTASDSIRGERTSIVVYDFSR